MKRVLAVLAGIAIVCAVAYLVSLNETRVDFHYAPAQHLAQVHLVTLLVFAFTAGVLLVLLGVVLQAGRRSLIAWGDNRRSRRHTRLDNWLEEGVRRLWEGDHQRGRTLLHRTWRRRPDDPQAVIRLAASYADTGELQRAVELLTAAAERHRTHPELLFALAETQRISGDSAAYVSTLERLRALHPRAVRLARTLRDAYVESGRWQEAGDLQELLVAEVRNGEAAKQERETLTMLRYEAALTLSDPEARLRALERLADGRSVPVPLSVSLGDALLAVGRRDEASILWERTLRNTPRTALVERLAAMASEPGHRERLRALLSKLRPDLVDADHVRVSTAQLHLADGDADAAARVLDTLRKPMDEPLVHLLWAEIHRRRGHLEQAVAAYAQASRSGAAHRCAHCGRIASQWIAHCPQCGSWDSYRSTIEIELPKGRAV
jgi:uncharacterized protein HemY